MTVKIEIAADKDATTWADLTGAIRLESVRMGGEASSGRAGSGFGFDFEDPAAAYDLPARRVVRLTVDDAILAAGRVSDIGVARMSPPLEDARRFAVNLSDGNAHLLGIPVHLWDRPEETDVERMTALCADFLAGSPRPSTNLAITYLSAADPQTLEKQRYDATNPAGVIADIVTATGKLCFVTVDDELFYDDPASVAYAAAISVTDEAPDIDNDEYGPIWTGTPGIRDGTEFYSGLIATYGDNGAIVSVFDASAETNHDYWREVIHSAATDEAGATEQLEKILPQRSDEEERFSFAILVPDSKVGTIKYGQTFSFRAAAAGVLAARDIRAGRVTWSMERPGLWRADIEGGFPKKVAPRLTRDGGPDVSPLVYQCNPAGKDVFAGTWEDIADYAGATTVESRVLTLYPENSPELGPLWAGKHFVLDTGLAPWRVSFLVTGSNYGGGSDDSQAAVRIMGPDDVGPTISNILTAGTNTALGAYYAVGVASASWYGGTLEFATSAPVRVEIENAPIAGARMRLTVAPTGNTTGWFDATLPETLTSVAWAAKGAYYGFPHTWTYVVSDIQVTTCGDPVYGQEVPISTLGTSDGLTDAWSTPYPYIYNTLRVSVDGIDWTSLVTQTDPATGAFTFDTIPADGDTIFVSYMAG